ncbi:hypothetical protein STA3757_30790 [Stanieria sp. NIES-3757]|nr:hypothetical protein STA3757_30790 [Stanieria sp. NIES-3757]
MNTKNTAKNFMIVLVGLTIAATGNSFAEAQQVYPAQGQSNEQQARDQQECSNWATSQTGYRPSGNSSSGGIVSDTALRGAARGAGLGAIGGLIGGNIGTGAAIGAAIGGADGGIRNQEQKGHRKEFDRAFAACMNGRGYSVK